MAEAINIQLNITSEDVFQQQQNVALIAEMYHTASLYHDDVIDKAELRRSKPSVNYLWGHRSSIMAGNYTIAISNHILSQLRDPNVSSLKNCLALSRRLRILLIFITKY